MAQTQFEKLKEVVADLRHPQNGCPWDLKQSHESLLKYLIEESYEFIEAVEQKDNKKMEEEIGDVLLQVLLHARLAEERNAFDIESVSKVLSEKLIRRHPHVFENKNSSISADEVVLNWEKIKQEINNEMDLSVSIGIAPTKVLAKVASNWVKPNGLTIITQETAPKFLSKKPIEKIWGIGPKTAEFLKTKNVIYAGEFVEKGIGRAVS